MKVALITNIPSPYRVSVFNKVSNICFNVIFCAKTEANRKWGERELDFNHQFLDGHVKAKKDGFNFVHNNPGVWMALSKLNPQVVITTGFNPTHLYAFAWAKLHRAKHICMTDGTVHSESQLSLVHRLVRRIVFAGTQAFIAASKSGVDLYRSYGVNDLKIFRSQLCANNDRFYEAAESSVRRFDVCFSGQFIDIKLPFFFVDVCVEIKAITGSCKVLLMGDGPLREQLVARLKLANIDFSYVGFVQQEDLPSYYASAKLLLFPTLNDAWGVVANEALAAGTPVITTPYAGVAHELVIDGQTGYVKNIDVNEWAEAALKVLQDDGHRETLATAGQKLVAEYNFKAAAEGIEAACLYVK